MTEPLKPRDPSQVCLSGVTQESEIDHSESNTPETDEAELARLATLDPLAYDRERKVVAQQLRVRPATIDALVAQRKGKKGDLAGAGRRLPFASVVPWPEPVNAGDVLDKTYALIARYVVADVETLRAATLWAALTWFTDVASVLPMAVITAPEKGCGKTTLLNVIGRLSRRPLSTANISPAALFRCVEAWSPTLLIDEADTFVRDNDELRGIINSGHTRETAQVIRAVEIGGEFEPRVFSTWGPKALAGIGRLPETILSRAVVLRLRRALPGERVANLRHADRAPFTSLCRQLARWAEDNGEVFAITRPEQAWLVNRSADNWEPLAALAELAGGQWPDRAKQAAHKLLVGQPDAPSVNEELLSDIREIFRTRGTDKIATETLLAALAADDEGPWTTWNHGKPLSARQLSKRLAEFGVRPTTIRVGDRTPRGYRLDQFTEVFASYLPDAGYTSATSQQSSKGVDFAHYPSATQPGPVADSDVSQMASVGQCCGVADKRSRIGDDEVDEDWL